MEPEKDPYEGYEDYSDYLDNLERTKMSAEQIESLIAERADLREQEILQKKLDEALAQRNAQLEEIEQRRRQMANPNWGTF